MVRPVSEGSLPAAAGLRAHSNEQFAGIRMASRTGGSGKGDGAPSSDADLARRLDRLSRDLNAGRQERAEPDRPASPDRQGFGLALRMASEFVAGVLVGAALGWGLDRVAGTSPWGLIGLLLLGFGAGVLNVVRAAGQMTTSATKDGRGGGEPP
jgi:ATP synthase protein I